MTIFRNLAVVATALILSACSQENAPSDTLIVNARVIDGSGSQEQSVSVRIVGDRIAAVGDIEPQANDTIIDANGLVLAPGFIDTDMTKVLPEEQRNALLAQVPLGRLGDSVDIANAVTFLASDAAAYVTGETLHVNGGMLMD